jgi:hypothetical protein
VPVSAPPFGAIRNPEAAQSVGREDRPEGGCAHIIGRRAVDDIVADLGADAVAANDNIGFRGDAIAERQTNRVAGFLDPDELVIEGDRARRDTLFQNRVQIAAVNMDVRPAEVPLLFGIEDDFVQRLAGVPGAAYVALRFDAGGAQRVFDAETAQHFRHVGAEDDAGANARKSRRLFVNAYIKASALQETRGA